MEIYAFALGIDPQKLDVTLDRGVLTLAGERPSTLPDSDPEATAPATSCLAAAFKRAISLPDDVDPQQVQANYRDGVLHVSLARREAC